MLLTVSQIVEGTEFSLQNDYRCSLYRLGKQTKPMSELPNEPSFIVGDRNNVGECISCAPKLGGQFQTGVTMWVHVDTKISIE